MLDWDTLVMKILPKEKELKMKMTRKILNSECRYGIYAPPPPPPPLVPRVECSCVRVKYIVYIV